MHLTRVRITDFRNIEELEFAPHQSINLIGGPNGSGKTSILEAIFYACTAKSFRGSSDEILLRNGAEIARIEVYGNVNGAETEVALAWGKGQKRQIKVDGVKLTRVADLFDYFHAVSYVSEDTELIYGPPSARRHLLDLYISQADRRYLSDLIQYNKVLAQRNALLKDFEIGEDEDSQLDMLEVWEMQLAEVGARINARRLKMITAARDKLLHFYRSIAGGDGALQWQLDSTIKEQPDSAEAFTARLREVRKRDLYFGSTSVGPHRDDVTVMLNGHPTRGYASQGEAKSAALAIKFAIYDYLSELLDETPILLLDELASDLDANRLAALMQTLPQLGQVFLTSARPEELRVTASIQGEIKIAAGKAIR
jgi:DNA replication and repair protein RecF